MRSTTTLLNEWTKLSGFNLSNRTFAQSFETNLDESQCRANCEQFNLQLLAVIGFSIEWKTFIQLKKKHFNWYSFQFEHKIHFIINGIVIIHFASVFASVCPAPFHPIFHFGGFATFRIKRNSSMKIERNVIKLDKKRTRKCEKTHWIPFILRSFNTL